MAASRTIDHCLNSTEYDDLVLVNRNGHQHGKLTKLGYWDHGQTGLWYKWQDTFIHTLLAKLLKRKPQSASKWEAKDFNVFLFEEWNCRQPYLALARQLSISILRFLRLVITMPRAGAILLGESLVESTFFYGFMDQNFPRSWDQGSNFWVKIWNQLWKNIPRYDSENGCFGIERIS